MRTVRRAAAELGDRPLVLAGKAEKRCVMGVLIPSSFSTIALVISARKS